MSIASELARLQQAKSDIKTAIEGKGVTVPSTASISTYDDYIAAIECSTGIPMPASATSVTLDDWARLTSVTIKSGVTSLPNYLYQDYYNLSSVTLPDTVTSIGDSAFGYCSALSIINIPSGVTSISNYMLQYASNLSGVTIPDGVTSIGIGAFCYCSGLTSITIPSGVTSIGNSAFYGCSGLTAITVNATTPPTLGSNVFGNTNDCPIFVPCGSVNAYKAAWSNYASRITCDSPVPPTPTGNKLQVTFTGGTSSSVTCDSTGVLTTGDTNFDGGYTQRQKIASAIIGDCVTAISGAFSSCLYLSSVTIPSGVTVIGEHSFNNCKDLSGLTLPSGVTSIGQQAFDGCEKLSGITIPDAVTSIGNNAFEGCTSLSSVTIPSGVTSIGISAFAYCSALTSVTINATTPPTAGEYPFGTTSDPHLTAIYVPSGSVNAYKSATNWSYYASLIQAIPPSSPFDFPFSINYNAKNYNAGTNTIAKTTGQLVNEDAVIIGDSSVISYSNGVLTFSPNTDWDGSQPTVVEFTGSTASYLDRSNQNSALTIVAKIQTVDGTYTDNCINEDPDTGECMEYESNWCGYYMNFLAGGGYDFLLNPPTSENECWDTDPDTGDCIDEHIFANCLYLNGSVNFWANSNATGLATVSVVVNENGATYKDYGTQATGNTSFTYDNYKTAHRMFYTGENQCTTYKFAWLFMSQSALTPQQIQDVINYNENL